MNVSTASASNRFGLRPRRLLGALVLAATALPLPWTAPSAHAAVAFNAATNADVDATTATVSHTPAGSDRLLTVCVAIEDTSTSVSTVVFNGTETLTKIGERNGPSGQPRVEVWRRIAPTATTANVVVTLGTAKKMVVGVTSFTGVDQTTPVDIPTILASASSATSSVTVASAVDDLVADCMGTKASPTTAPSVGALQTSRFSREEGGAIRGAGSTEPGAASVTMTWGLPESNRWAVIGYNINAAVNNCGNGSLDGGEQCDNGGANGTAGNCCSSTCTYQPSTTACHASAGVCDLAENCTGASGTCPADSFVSSSTTCRASAGVCDSAETCTGNSAACPADGFAASTVECRGSAGVCDVAETCPGNAAACPADAFQPSSVTCRGDAGICDVAEVCPGNAAACPADAFESDGFPCGSPIADACTAADTCDGNGGCQTNHEPDGTVCRAAAGSCDVEETCLDGACPADSVLDTTTVCRASAGSCDIAENCDGVNPACPADAVEDTDTVCRASAGVCDVAETCDGSTAACPADTVEDTDTVCRASAGVCDVAETCDGSTAACPADVVEDTDTVCRASAGVCDVEETCDGSTAACPANAVADTDTVCRASAGVCDVAETCDGSTAACPADAVEDTDTVCRASAGSCDVEETCDGATTACPADAVEDTDTVCRASAGVCDIAETCDGSTAACPADTVEDTDTVCRASAGVCDVAETCDGSTAACPADSFVSAATVCRAEAFECDAAENCTGSSADCPADVLDPVGTLCTDDGNVCTSNTCNINGVCIATANQAPCDDGNPCTANDTCFGQVCQPGGPANCDDGSVCTEDSCDEGVGCVNEVAMRDPGSCFVSGWGRVRITESNLLKVRSLKWLWRRGGSVDPGMLGDPRTTTDYGLCIFDQSGGETRLAGSLDVPASFDFWRSKPGSAKYRDKKATVNGVSVLNGRATIQPGKSSFRLKAKGANVVLPTPASASVWFDQEPSLVIQLINSVDGCWMTEFLPEDASKNTPTKYRAKYR